MQEAIKFIEDAYHKSKEEAISAGSGCSHEDLVVYSQLERALDVLRVVSCVEWQEGMINAEWAMRHGKTNHSGADAVEILFEKLQV